MAHQADVLIVGAGICGTMVASQLVGQTSRITILDKGRGPGGRMATRRVGSGRADHGAQFFTARDPRFEAWLQQWHNQDLVFEWSTGWSDGSLSPAAPTGHPRFAVRGGMAALIKQVATELTAQGVSIVANTRATALSPHANGWRTQTEDGDTWDSRAVVLALPVPQALALLDAGQTQVSSEQRAALDKVRYAPCLCALAGIDGGVDLPSPGALQRPGDEIAWIADNRRKGISPDSTILTLHGSPAWSEANFTVDDAPLHARFRAALQPWLAPAAHINELQIVRWRYALPVELYPQRFLRADGLPYLYFGGDAFGAPRIEGAMLSGLTLGQALAGQMAAT